MRKLCSLLLILSLLPGVFAVTATAEDETISFEPALTMAWEGCVDDWYASSINRALLTVLLWIDYSMAFKDSPYEIDLMQESAVCVDDGVLLVCYNTENMGGIIIDYAPGLDTASVIRDCTKFDESMVNAGCLAGELGSEYKMNSWEDLATVVHAFSEELSS